MLSTAPPPKPPQEKVPAAAAGAAESDECPLCVAGSGKVKGHKGRHKGAGTQGPSDGWA